MPPKAELLRTWLVKAQRDLVVARRALEGDPAIADAACFHCQQAVEKSLKAMLVFREIEPPRTHLIGILLKRLGHLDDRMAAMRDDLEWLTAFAVDVRYPQVEDEPTVEQAQRALTIAEKAVRVILETMPPEIRL